MQCAQTNAKVLSISAIQYAEENGQLCCNIDKLTATIKKLTDKIELYMKTKCTSFNRKQTKNKSSDFSGKKPKLDALCVVSSKVDVFAAYVNQDVSQIPMEEESYHLEEEELWASDEKIPEEFPQQTLVLQLPLCHQPLVKMVPRELAIPKEETAKGSKGHFQSLGAWCMQLEEHWKVMPRSHNLLGWWYSDSPSPSFDPAISLPPPC